ncbi:AT-rich interactive domain-containing protein 1B-like [Lethenteron reissneri]|uniref:AT-rich interactive domain-containing protein 1B-like n=1 Tax=Lethenteron reissneri TaxID=7753 RepID=UPI002AB7A101|nr:AT-rich interactive domain-containing protein 1B-like [Lethenteron reissneri]
MASTPSLSIRGKAAFASARKLVRPSCVMWSSMVAAAYSKLGQLRDIKAQFRYGEWTGYQGTVQGVTIPSQRRYVYYYSYLVTHALEYRSTPVLLHKITFETIPMFSGGTCNPHLVVYKEKMKLLSLSCVRREDRCLVFTLPRALLLCEDVKMEFFNKQNMMMKKMFHFWINTFFIQEGLPSSGGVGGGYIGAPPAGLNGAPPEVGAGGAGGGTAAASAVGGAAGPPPGMSGGGVGGAPACVQLEVGPGGVTRFLTLTLNKAELDKANKDKANKCFSPNFKVKLYFTAASEERVADAAAADTAAAAAAAAMASSSSSSWSSTSSLANSPGPTQPPPQGGERPPSSSSSSICGAADGGGGAAGTMAWMAGGGGGHHHHHHHQHLHLLHHHQQQQQQHGGGAAVGPGGRPPAPIPGGGGDCYGVGGGGVGGGVGAGLCPADLPDADAEDFHYSDTSESDPEMDTMDPEQQQQQITKV